MREITALNNDITSPHYKIRLIEHNIIAILTVTPGKRHPGGREVLKVQLVEEEIELYNNLDSNEIINELEQMGITERINRSAIEEATRSLTPFEAIIAKGHLPVEGFNGDLYLHSQIENNPCSEHGKIDFREMNPIETVEENGLVATYLPAVPGVDGMDLFGNPVPTKEVFDLNLRLGEQVERRGNKIYALAPGRLLIEKHCSFIKIEVKSEFIHDGTVNLSSGNIKFNGDVRIGEDVENSMTVSATGKIFIGGSVRKATIDAGRSLAIQGHVFSSTVSVGMQEVLEEKLAEQLDELLCYLDQMQKTIHQIIDIRGVHLEDVDAGELKELVRVILKEKYFEFHDKKRDFIRKIKKRAAQLSSDWIPVTDKLYSVFTDTSLTTVRNAADFSQLLEEGRALVKHYTKGESSNNYLKIPYAVNSILSCNGTIEVTEAGLHNCSVTANKKVFIEGCCRGGEIKAREKVSIKETGSMNGVKTVIMTDKEGVITIGLARCGTEIWVGGEVHHFDTDKLGVHARIVDGRLCTS